MKENINLISSNNLNKSSSSKNNSNGDKIYDEIEKKEKEIKNLN